MTHTHATLRPHALRTCLEHRFGRYKSTKRNLDVRSPRPKRRPRTPTPNTEQMACSSRMHTMRCHSLSMFVVSPPTSMTLLSRRGCLDRFRFFLNCGSLGDHTDLYFSNRHRLLRSRMGSGYVLWVAAKRCLSVGMTATCRGGQGRRPHWCQLDSNTRRLPPRSHIPYHFAGAADTRQPQAQPRVTCCTPLAWALHNFCHSGHGRHHLAKLIEQCWFKKHKQRESA